MGEEKERERESLGSSHLKIESSEREKAHFLTLMQLGSGINCLARRLTHRH